MLHVGENFRQMGFVEIQTAIYTLHPRGAFRIARQRSVPFANVILRIENEGVVGWGEASPNPYYGVSPEDVVSHLTSASDWLRELKVTSVEDIAAVWSQAFSRLQQDRAAQCALDVALWDWLARTRQTSVCHLAHGRPPQPVTSFATIGLSQPEEIPGKLAELRGFPRVKIKSDATGDLNLVRRVKAELGAMVAIDANCAWRPKELPGLSIDCGSAGAEFIEQPFPATHDTHLKRGSYALPILAD